MDGVRAVDDREIVAALGEASVRWYAEKARRKRGEFIRGPVLMHWVERAFRQPGKASAIAMLLRFMAGMNGIRNIRVTPKLLTRFNVGRNAGYRTVAALAREGLITTDRAKGKCAVVSIISDEQ